MTDTQREILSRLADGWQLYEHVHVRAWLERGWWIIEIDREDVRALGRRIVEVERTDWGLADSQRTIQYALRAKKETKNG